MIARLIVALLATALAVLPWPSAAAAADAVDLHVFWSETCPHCLQARPAVAGIAAERPWLRVHEHEIGAPENARLYVEQAGALGRRAQYVPAFLFCGEMHVGFGPETPALLSARLDACRAGAAGRTAPLTLPILGEVGPETASLPLLTVALAGLDAFNPCAFFVLLFLLSVIAHTRDRGRMLLVGGIFVLCSGLVYFAFMAAWLNLFLVTRHIGAVTAAAGAVALAMGALNVKDYFLWGRGPSLSIPTAARPRLVERMRRLSNAAGLPATIAGTLVLAVGANGYELLCTAGFPMVFTRLLSLHALGPGEQLLYLAFYNLVYVLPLAAIVVAFALALRQRKLTEAQGRTLKLLAGTMLAGLGAALLLAPGLLDQPGWALALPVAAAGVTALIRLLWPPDRAAERPQPPPSGRHRPG